MDRTNPSLVVLLFAFVVAVGSNTGNSTRKSTVATTERPPDAFSSRVNGCLRTSLCCRLGRKAVRLSYPVMYTCKIEALAQGLEYHTSVSHRLKLTPKVGQTDRMEAANSLHMSFGFRKRLMLCRAMGQMQKECFESCCERKLQEYQAKTRRITQTGKEQ